MLPDYRPTRLAIHSTVVTLVCTTLMAGAASAQQPFVTRYDAFVGYSWLSSPAIDLSQRDLHVQVGFRPATWYSLGFDYTNVAGTLNLTPDLLPSPVQDQLRGQLGQLAAAGRLPAGYALAVPVRARTQTFTAGPQFAYRRWIAITPFIRPSCGLIREVARPEPADPIAQGIVAQLAPEGKVRDWTPFYGVGGGIDLNFNRNFAFRVQADYVWDHLFPNILRDGRNTVRFSIGPAFNFGRNIVPQ